MSHIKQSIVCARNNTNASHVNRRRSNSRHQDIQRPWKLKSSLERFKLCVISDLSVLASMSNRFLLSIPCQILTATVKLNSPVFFCPLHVNAGCVTIASSNGNPLPPFVCIVLFVLPSFAVSITSTSNPERPCEMGIAWANWYFLKYGKPPWWYRLRDHENSCASATRHFALEQVPERGWKWILTVRPGSLSHEFSREMSYIKSVRCFKTNT